MTNKQAFISGAAQRIGRSIAIGLAEMGYDVALHYNSSRNEAEQLASHINTLGRKCQIYQADFSQPHTADKMFLQVLNDFPELNILINSASNFDKGTIASSTPDEITKTMNIHLTTPWVMLRRLTQQRSSGIVINILDSTIVKTRYKHAPYFIGKKSLAELTRMAAKEFAPHFRINGLAPGYVLPSKDTLDQNPDLRTINPLQKIIAIDSLMATVTFLITNPDITGQIIFIDGGDSL